MPLVYLAQPGGVLPMQTSQEQSRCAKRSAYVEGSRLAAARHQDIVTEELVRVLSVHLPLAAHLRCRVTPVRARKPVISPIRLTSCHEIAILIRYHAFSRRKCV